MIVKKICVSFFFVCFCFSFWRAFSSSSKWLSRTCFAVFKVNCAACFQIRKYPSECDMSHTNTNCIRILLLMQGIIKSAHFWDKQTITQTENYHIFEEKRRTWTTHISNREFHRFQKRIEYVKSIKNYGIWRAKNKDPPFWEKYKKIWKIWWWKISALILFSTIRERVAAYIFPSFDPWSPPPPAPTHTANKRIYLWNEAMKQN